MQGNNSLYQTAKDISKRLYFIQNNIVTLKSFSFSYLKYRVLRPVLKLYYKSLTAPRQFAPWTSPASIVIFDAILNKNMRGFEYGSGKSTVYFSQKLGQLSSVEHHKGWHELVHKLLKKQHANNVEYLFSPKEEKLTEEIEKGTQEFYDRHGLSATEFQVRKDYYHYFSLINKYENESFDFILVDGRARVECGLNAIPKLKRGGILVLDNSERKRYELLRKRLKSWPSVHTTTGLTDTTLWFKP
jgi:hypothetical protein